MGNYKNIETDFVERTLNLLSQYESLVHKYDFKEQYNYTLLINCLLGLVVLPKEKSVSYLPTTAIDQKLKVEMGLVHSTINSDYNDMRSLIIAMRHSLSHFNVEIESIDEQFHIDKIIFNVDPAGTKVNVITFQADELLPFIRYYANWYLSHIAKYKK